MVENGRKRRHFSSPKKASYIASSITLSYFFVSRLCRALISMPFCILVRHCSAAREYAVRLKARKAIVAVERRAKKIPFLVPTMQARAFLHFIRVL